MRETPKVVTETVVVCGMCQGTGVVTKRRPKGAIGPRTSAFTCPCRWRIITEPAALRPARDGEGRGEP